MSAGLYSDSAVRYFGKLALIAAFPIQEGFVSKPLRGIAEICFVRARRTVRVVGLL
jgi:hypothetical protein